MLATLGDGITAPCCHCERRLFYSEVTKDLFPKPARRGGRYVRGNVRVLCMSCNARDGAKQAALERAIEAAKKEVRKARRRELYALKKASSAPCEPLWGQLGTSVSEAA